LPETLIRFVPVVANARIPGRALIGVYLALAILAAYALAPAHGRVTRRWEWLVPVLVLFEYGGGGVPLYRLETPGIYDAVRVSPADDGNAILELPSGLRDGLEESGRLDHRILVHQTTHGRPILGGFVARLSPKLRAEHLAAPVIGQLLALSADRQHDGSPTIDNREAVAAILRRWSIRYVIVDRATASPALRQYVDSALPLRLIRVEGSRALYEVDSVNAATGP
jgi:hypothetical protein